MMRSSLRWSIPTCLALQLGLLWIQGAQLHRQNQVLQGLREDLQALAETLENSQSAASSDEDGGAVPAHILRRTDMNEGGPPGRFAPSTSPLVLPHVVPGQSPATTSEAPWQVAVLGVEEEQEATAKDLKTSRDSAQKAVQDAREVRSKLSIEENIRKADEAKKLQAATDSWQRWGWGAIVLVVVALVVRSLLPRRR